MSLGAMRPTVPHVSEELIDKTWRAVGALDASDQILRMQNRHRRAQRALTLFAYMNFLDFREDAAGVGIYVYHVVLEAFSEVLPRPRSVRRAQIEQSWKDQRQLPDFDPEASIEQSPEPHALRYVYEALTEDSDEVVLSEHELELVFGALQAVIACLHDACKAR